MIICFSHILSEVHSGLKLHVGRYNYGKETKNDNSAK